MSLSSPSTHGPQRIVCLTEETTEWLYLLGQEARIVGICRAHRSFFGGPYVFTTYDRAVQYAPNQRKMLSFILAALPHGPTRNTLAPRTGHRSPQDSKSARSPPTDCG